MKGSNKNRRDWFGYLMNFVAVCLGIVITFAGQGLINRHAERNEVKSSLMLVKNELQDNNIVEIGVPAELYRTLSWGHNPLFFNGLKLQIIFETTKNK